MSKILKNTTLSDYFWGEPGINVPASGQVTIPFTKYLEVSQTEAISEITADINSGDIVVNDGTNDLSASEGIAYLQYPDDANNILFTGTTSGLSSNTAREAIDEAAENADTALNTPRYTLLLQHNGTVSNGTFLGYSSLIPGDAIPVLIPISSDLIEFTFSNQNSNADYTLEFRKGSTVATPFYTVSKVNTQFFVDTTINESFVTGDEIYVKYVDDGNNASDAVMVLFFKATP